MAMNKEVNMPKQEESQQRMQRVILFPVNSNLNGFQTKTLLKVHFR
jgi:hypothetical protein